MKWTNLDITSSQNVGNKTNRWARQKFSFFSRACFRCDGKWRTDAVSEWITNWASSWRTQTISSILTLGSGCSPATTIFTHSKDARQGEHIIVPTRTWVPSSLSDMITSRKDALITDYGKQKSKLWSTS